MARIDIQFFRFARSFFGLGIGSVASAATFLVLSKLPTGFRTFDADYALYIIPGALIIFMFAVPCGFLAHAILYSQNWRWLPAYAAAAAIEAALYGILGSMGRVTQSNLEMMAMAMPSAAVCAAVAWLIRRPDKDSTP